MRPSISFGTVQDLLAPVDHSLSLSSGNLGSLNVYVSDRVGPSSAHATVQDGPVNSIGPSVIPSSHQAKEDFDNLISDMVEEIFTCQKCMHVQALV